MLITAITIGIGCFISISVINKSLFSLSLVKHLRISYMACLCYNFDLFRAIKSAYMREMKKILSEEGRTPAFRQEESIFRLRSKIRLDLGYITV